MTPLALCSLHQGFQLDTLPAAHGLLQGVLHAGRMSTPRTPVWGFGCLTKLKLCLHFPVYDTSVPQLLCLQSVAGVQASRATSQLMEKTSINFLRGRICK